MIQNLNNGHSNQVRKQAEGMCPEFPKVNYPENLMENSAVEMDMTTVLPSGLTNSEKVEGTKLLFAR